MKSLKIRLILTGKGLEIFPQQGAFTVETDFTGKVFLAPKFSCDEILLDIPVPEIADLQRVELKHHPV